ncbi:hypothetical protein F2Q70_00017643 [Brassica cretica]|uniref:Uncharacterized protein n=1 Tax=Brassica cretica TaxID=69181 RepID=A0A8S9HZS1_BRACR|nr:hypothetical protein F2Q70_00017643 [Brassica cretica]
MGGDLPTVRLSSSFDTRYSFELAFQYHQFEVNQHPVAEVMPVLLKSVSIDAYTIASIDTQSVASINANTIATIDARSVLTLEPLDLERLIHKSKRAVDTLQAAIGSVEIQTTSTSTEGTTSTSTDDTTSTSTDGRTSTSTDGTTSTSTDDTTSTSIDGTTSTSIDSTTSTSTNGTTSTSIDDVKKEVTMEDFLELEEWLEDMDQNSEKKLDDDENTSRGHLETSPKASIGRHQPDEIDRHPPCIIDLHPPESIDPQPLLDEPHCFIVEMEPIEERMHESEASHNVDSKHLRSLIYAEKAAGLHKRVKRIHDHVKIVIPCAVVEVEFPIPPNRCMQLSPYIGVLDDPLHAEAYQRGLRFRDKVDKGPAEAASIDTDQIPSNDTTDAISNDINKPVSIETATSPSIDTGRISKQKEFEVCGNLFDGETTTRSDKSGGRGGIGRRGKGPREVLSYHWSLGSQMVSGNPECAADASQSHLQSFEHSLLLR